MWEISAEKKPKRHLRKQSHSSRPALRVKVVSTGMTGQQIEISPTDPSGVEAEAIHKRSIVLIFVLIVLVIISGVGLHYLLDVR